jgi:hypothetical protein
VRSGKAALNVWSWNRKGCRLAILEAWRNDLGGGYLGRISRADVLSISL